MKRLHELFVALICLTLGPLTLLTSATMTVDMLVQPERRAENLFWVGLVALAISPPIVVAGVRLLLNKPNRHGGLFSPNVLRLLAIFNGVVGGTIVILAIQQRDFRGILGGISFVLVTQGAFVMADKREAT
jgi:hypothetical protein